MDSTSDYSREVLSRLERDVPFEVQANYDRDGDCIEFIFADEDFRAERVDSLVTVYYGRGSGEIVGTLIKGLHVGVRAVLEKLPGFSIEIQDGRIRLEHLFTAKMWSEANSDAKRIVYRKLREAAVNADIEAEYCQTG